MNKKPRILINGKEVSSLQDLPPEVRKFMKDENNNNIPDMLEGGIMNFLTSGKLQDLTKMAGQMNQYNIDGKIFNKLSEMAPETQALLKAKLKEAQYNNPEMKQAIGTIMEKTGLPGITNDSSTTATQASAQQVNQQTSMASRNPNPINIPKPPIISKDGVQDDHRNTILIVLGFIGTIAWLIFEYGDKL